MRALTPTKLAERTIQTLARLEEVHNGDIVLLSPFTGRVADKHLLQHSCEYEWYATLHSILNKGTGCPKCGGKNSNARPTQEDVEQKIFDKHQGNIILLDKYTNARDKLRFKCTQCDNVWKTSTDSITRGTGCNNCVVQLQKIYSGENAEEQKSRNKKCLESLSQIYSDSINLITQEPFDPRDKQLFHVKECNHTIETLFSTLLKGKGCTHKDCVGAKIASSKRTTDAQYITMLEDTGWQLHDTYLGIGIKIKHKCKKCSHIQPIKPTKVFRGRQCDNCEPSRSIGETYFEKKLTETNEVFETEKKFDTLMSNRNYQLRFDFYVPEKSIAIEIQGAQHFKPNIFFGEDNFKRLQENDNIKRQYCEDNGITLIEIPYDKGINDSFKYFCEHAINIITLFPKEAIT